MYVRLPLCAWANWISGPAAVCNLGVTTLLHKVDGAVHMSSVRPCSSRYQAVAGEAGAVFPSEAQDKV